MSDKVSNTHRRPKGIARGARSFALAALTLGCFFMLGGLVGVNLSLAQALLAGVAFGTADVVREMTR